MFADDYRSFLKLVIIRSNDLELQLSIDLLLKISFELIKQFIYFQIPGDLVAVEMSNHETPREDNDRLHLVHRFNDDPPLGHILRPGGHLRRRAGRPVVHRSMAGFHERSPLLLNRQPGLLLHLTNDPHHSMLRFNLDQSVETQHPDRHQRRTDGKDAAEIESQGGEDAGRRGDIIRVILATLIRNLRED